MLIVKLRHAFASSTVKTHLDFRDAKMCRHIYHEINTAGLMKNAALLIKTNQRKHCFKVSSAHSTGRECLWMESALGVLSEPDQDLPSSIAPGRVKLSDTCP